MHSCGDFFNGNINCIWEFWSNLYFRVTSPRPGRVQRRTICKTEIMSLLGDLALQQCPVGWFSCLRKSHYQPYGQRHRSGISIFVILPLGRFFANHHCLETRSRTEAPRKLLSVRCLVVKIWHHPPRSRPASAFRCKMGLGTSQIAQQWYFPLALLQGPRFFFKLPNSTTTYPIFIQRTM